MLICLPLIKEGNNSTNLGGFFKNIMFSTQFDQTESCNHVAKLINYLNSTPIFILAEFKELLISMQTNERVSAAVKTQSSVQHPVQPQYRDITTSQPSAVTTKQTTVPSIPKPSYGNPSLPQGPIGARPTKQQAAVVEDTDKKISLYYLLQHYNKENAAIYKQQKAVKKEAKKVRTMLQ